MLSQILPDGSYPLNHKFEGELCLEEAGGVPVAITEEVKILEQRVGGELDQEFHQRGRMGHLTALLANL